MNIKNAISLALPIISIIAIAFFIRDPTGFAVLEDSSVYSGNITIEFQGSFAKNSTIVLSVDDSSYNWSIIDFLDKGKIRYNLSNQKEEKIALHGRYLISTKDLGLILRSSNHTFTIRLKD